MARKRRTTRRHRTGRAVAARRVGRKGGRRGAATSTGPLLAQMTAYRAELAAQQARLQSGIDKLTEAISVLGGAGEPVGRRGRPRLRRAAGEDGLRKGSLKSYILKVIPAGQAMAVREIAAAVRRAGYKTKSNNFPNQVSNALANTPGVSKVRRGLFKVTG